MKIFEKPLYNVGWVRWAGFVVLALVAAWTVMAAVLRGLGDLPWLAWSGYQSFTLLDGIELAVLPLAAGLIAGWLEEQDLKVAREQSRHQENERAAAARQKEILQRVHAEVLELFGGRQPDPARVDALARLKVAEIVQTALPDLNGKGKGEVLHFLYEQGLLDKEKPAAVLDALDFRETVLHHPHLNGIYLAGVDLSRAKLDRAQLAGSRFSGANLSRAFLRHTNLRDADLTGSCLRGAHLEHANLDGADLTGADLDGAFLMHTNLQNCRITGADPLAQAILIDTIISDGRKMTNEKGKEYLRNKEIAGVIDRL